MSPPMKDWQLKIFAYLHDPPDKPLAFGRPPGHAAWGRALAEKLGARPPAAEADRWERLVERADHLAAGADRSALLPRQEVTVDELRHPLSGRPIELDEARLDLRQDELREQAKRALEQELEEIARHTNGDPQAAFLGVWGLLPARLRHRTGRHELRGLWDLLPAETRMPNHPVAVHAALVSALTTVLATDESPGLLSLSVGPVQRFIAQARRASDLWAGSVILAQAVLAGVRPIVQELGPDHVVFPALRSSRAFLAWLVERSQWSARLRPLWPDPDGLGDPDSLGSLPNRLLAVVPAGRAKDLAKQCEQAIRDWWERFVADHAQWLERRTPDLAGYEAMARGQAGGYLRVTWAVMPWPAVDRLTGTGAAAVTVASWGRGGQIPRNVDSYLALMREVRQNPGGGPRPFEPNGGILYSACYESVERLAAAVKLTPRSVPRAEGGLKCSLCGERGVVPDAVPFEVQRTRWSWIRASFADDLDVRGLLRRGEALCGVCWAKRRFGFEKREQGVPSTSEIAAAPFKALLAERLARDDAPAELRRAVETLAREVEQSGGWEDAFVVSWLRRWKDERGPAGELVRIPGEVLLAFPREDRESDAEPVPGAIARRAAELRALAERCGVPRPRPYLAALVLDGDEMGKWLSGAKAIPLGEYLSDGARQELESHFREWSLEALLGVPWPMTPALHAAFSDACGVFSQRTARRTLEGEALGVLVYAGGDDVLALVPVGPGPGGVLEVATEIARRLRFRFSGHVRRDNGADIVDPGGREAGFVLDRWGHGLAFGGRATASAGIAVFHHRWPLGRALEEARAAEEFAKRTLGRDALGLTILRRSGQTTLTGLGFRPRGRSLPELLELALPIADGAIERHAERAAAADRDTIRNAIRVLADAAAKREGDQAGQWGSVDPVRAFQVLCWAFSDEGPLSPRLVSEVGQRLARLSGWSAEQDEKQDSAAEDPQHLGRWLGLIEAAAFFGRGGTE